MTPASPDDGALVRVVDATFAYGDRPVLRGVSLAIAAGEVLCLLGPNGSGKTTLLRCIAGALQPLSGSVRLADRDVSTLAPREVARIVGVVFQEHAAPFAFSALDVVLMGRAPHLGVFAAPSAADAAIAERVMAQIGITHLAARPYTAISGGERQLVLIAQALCQRPRVLLLDEPTSHLDYRNAMLVLRTVQTLAEGGMAVVMTTHAPDHPLLIDSTAALLRDGRLVALGSAGETVTTSGLSDAYGMRLDVVGASVPGRERPVHVVVPSLASLRPGASSP